ncbi:MAG TPA: HD domain-containing phosphohydrolase [Gemmatimonas sp.]|uniref:response regulator n=1 Tax=Gemmatimonas sp. TaxID=1962908 RepID=UPI002ED955C7
MPTLAKRLQDPRRTLLLVDDEPTNLHILRNTLQEEYRLLFARSGQQALDLAAQEHPDLILLDIVMPGMSGYEVCRALKSDACSSAIPVVFVTGLTEAADEQHGLELGAVDYISKPFNPHIVRARVRTHLSLVQATEVRETRLQIVQCLGKAAEFKDSETGMHVVRMSHYARIVGAALGYTNAAADDLLHAAPMHDIGKIGIPDAILQKAGALTQVERTIMEQHTVIGARIIGEHATGMLQMAGIIALNHHEKWDGTGYPNRLSGDEIPHVARVVAVADVFDALTSDRPYKRAWSTDEAFAFIRRECGTHFDPAVAEAFADSFGAVLESRERWADEKELAVA